MTADLHVAYRTRSLKVLTDTDLWIEGHIQAGERLEGRLPEASTGAGGWKERARRAEAEREAARTLAYSTEHQVDAEMAPLERALDSSPRLRPGGSPRRPQAEQLAARPALGRRQGR